MAERVQETAWFVRPRPTLTPMFICSILFWGACAIGYSSGMTRTVSDGFTLGAIGAACFIAFIVMSAHKNTRLFCLAMAATAVGMCLGSTHAALVHMEADQLTGLNETVNITIIEDSNDYGYGESTAVAMTTDDGRCASLSAQFGGEQPLLAGQRLRCRCTFSPPDYERSPYHWSEGLSGTLKVTSYELIDENTPLSALLKVRERAIDAIGSEDDTSRLLQALVCGYRHDVRDTELYAWFQTCGLAHLVAVSGAHLMIVTGLFASFFRCFRVPRHLSIMLLIAVMFCYFVLAGMPVSALRALVMAALGLTSFFGKRRSSSLNAIGLGVIGIVATSPSTCLSVSFALSGLSTIGIVLFAPLFQSWFESTPLGSARFIVDSLSLTLAAGVSSQLFACSLFSQLPLVSPFANVVTVPLFPLVCTMGFLEAVVALILPVAAPAIESVASLPISLLMLLVKTLAAVPLASIPVSIDTFVAIVLSLVVALFLWIWWPRRIKQVIPLFALVISMLIGLVLIPTPKGDTITMLDVGQGDAILVQSRGASLLIDTGNQDSQLLEQLGRNRVIHLDSVLISHADDDHCGSLDALRRAVSVDRVIVSAEMLDCTGDSAQSLVREAKMTAGSVVGVFVGDTFQVGAFTVRVVWPEQFVDEGGNADSLCVVLEYDGDENGVTDAVALMTGDAESEQLKAMIDEGAIGHVDILKVGHHGSRNGSTREQMNALSPCVALISCGENNRYGHPAEEIIEQLDAVGASVFRTDLMGEVSCTITPETISVKCTQ